MTSINFNVRMMWATPIIQCRYPGFASLNPRLAEILKAKTALGEHHRNKREWPNKGGDQWESEFDLFTHPEAEIREVARFCDSAVHAAIRSTAQEEMRSDAQFEIIYESWFHITGYGGYHSVHDHGSCSWCGVYCVQAGNVDEAKHPNSGRTKFYDPRRTTNSQYEGRYDPGLTLDRPLYIPPEDGQLVLFPNYLLHEQVPYFGTEPRIIISFNSRAMTKGV
jgi:uncharacterized protein (TIGR02466 family)